MFKLRTLAVAICAVSSGLAANPLYAAIESDNLPLASNTFADPDFDPDNTSIGGIGEMFVSVIARNPGNPSEDRSYVRDLGVTSRTLIDALLGGTLPSQSLSFGPDANMTSFLADNAGATFSFNVTAVHNPSGFNPNTFASRNVGYLSTSNESESAVASKQPDGFAETSSPTAGVQSFINGANIKMGGTTADNTSALFSPGEFGFHDNNWGIDRVFGFGTEGGMDTPLAFWFISLDNTDNAVSAAPQLLGNWTLDSFGALNFQPVPVPPALLMFAPAAIGLARARRRSKQV